MGKIGGLHSPIIRQALTKQPRNIWNWDLEAGIRSLELTWSQQESKAHEDKHS